MYYNNAPSWLHLSEGCTAEAAKCVHVCFLDLYVWVCVVCVFGAVLMGGVGVGFCLGQLEAWLCLEQSVSSGAVSSLSVSCFRLSPPGPLGLLTHSLPTSFTPFSVSLSLC